MLHQPGNLKTKILKTTFVTIHLALISLGLVSCFGQAPNLPEQRWPQKEQNNQQEANDDNDDNNDDDKDDDDND
jgi:hypothetical protein